jgi:hypothetical protein
MPFAILRASYGSVLCLALLAAPTAGAETSAGGAALASVQVSSGALSITPRGDYERLVLTVSGPGNFNLRREFDRGQSPYLPLFDANGAALADGPYTYELQAVPVLEPGLRAQLRAAHEAADLAAEARLAARVPRAPEAQVGSFTIAGGQVIPGDLREPAARAVASASQSAPSPDTTFTDSLCVGFDCPAAPSFGDTTILMMENNTRIKFDDTSSSAGFPNRDWALNANDSASGGLNRFWIQDCGASSQGSCTGNAVFSIEAGARANALYVDDGGRLGLGTATPVLDIHNKRGNTPALRMEQDASSGFTAQTWDIAGNEANFFVRDVTGGSRLPFRIRPGAPTSSLDISASGNVGIGTASPSTPLHVRRSDATAKLLVEETNATVIGRVMAQFINNGATTFRFENSATAQVWAFGTLAGGNFFIGAIPGQGLAFQMDTNGNVTTTGTVNGVSDRNAKADIAEVDPQAVLAKVAELPISTWRFKQASERHMGPMAQDFAAAFGLGTDDKHIALNDLSGVALAAIKALHATVNAKEAELVAQQATLRELSARNDELAQRLASIEAALAQQH